MYIVINCITVDVLNSKPDTSWNVLWNDRTYVVSLNT